MTTSASTPAVSAIIIGAGRTGRGLAAVLCQRSGVAFDLVDSDSSLVSALRAAGSYPVEVLGSRPPQILTLTPRAVMVMEDRAWHAAALRARVIFTSVFGTNLPALAPALASIISARHAAGAGPLDIITCENLTRAAAVLRSAVSAAMPPSGPALSACAVGFVEAMVLTTSLAAQSGHHPLSVRTQNAFRLPCDGDALCQGPLAIQGLEPLAGFEHQLRRKIYTYNGINAVISYLGAERGHEQLALATRDPEIMPWAVAAGEEASAALIAEYGFAADEQARWQQDALAKFADADIPDPISRNAADPARKLAADDRLVGPALLALRHGLVPRALARGILAAAHYRCGSEPSLLERHGSLPAVLHATAGLAADHPLVVLAASARSAQAQGPR